MYQDFFKCLLANHALIAMHSLFHTNGMKMKSLRGLSCSLGVEKTRLRKSLSVELCEFLTFNVPERVFDGHVWQSTFAKV